MAERAVHISPRTPEEKRAIFGFNAGTSGVPVGLVPVELSLQPGQYARCLFAIITAADDAPAEVKVDLEYSLDTWDETSGNRTWQSVFLDADTRLIVNSGCMQIRGPVFKFAPYPDPLEFRNEWAVGLVGAKRVLIRPNVESTADVDVRCELVMEIRKDY